MKVRGAPFSIHTIVSIAYFYTVANRLYAMHSIMLPVVDDDV